MTSAAVAVLSGLLTFGQPSPTATAALGTVERSQIEEPTLDTLERSPIAWHGVDTVEHPRIEVPFVAQEPLLCGGAAAAMVERFWGVRGVYGEDFRHLVRNEEGGIRASELTSALTERGYAVDVFRDQPDRVFAALRAGVPPILLLESGATRLHYVVLVGLEGDATWIHDPNFGPAQRMTREELLHRWRASGYWALVATPAGAATTSEEGAEPTPKEGVEPTSEEEAERMSEGESGAVDTAMQRLRAGDLEGARAAARELLGGGESETAIGRRILATGWFLDGNRGRALEEWNELGEPTIDLVRIEGMKATRYHVAADRMALRHGEVLTAPSLALARRRLSALPAVQASRVAYRPLPDGTVEVQASVLERRRVPDPPALAIKGVGGLLNRQVALDVGPLIAAGDRWRATGSWQPAQRYVGGSVSVPAPPFPGIATVGFERRRERFGLPASQNGGEAPVVTESRRRGSLELQEWVHPRLRLGVSVALESWEVPSRSLESGELGSGELETGDAEARLVGGGLSARWTSDDDVVWLLALGDGWVGSGRSFRRGSLEAGAMIPRGTRREWRFRAGGIAVSRDAPRMLWPGAGSDRIRDPLLRAHGLVANDAIRGPALGRHLLHGTAEHRVFRRFGPTRMGASVFLDAAHARLRGGTARDRGFVDVGAGVFVAAGPDEVAMSLARGSSGWRLSAQVGSGR